MSTKLNVLPGSAPDEIDLELLLAGAVEDPDAAWRIAEAADGPLAEIAAELDAYREGWALAPPLPVPGVLSVVGAPRAVPSTSPWQRRVGWGLALAAAALLTATAALGPRPGALGVLDLDRGGVRAMGMLPVDVSVDRAGTQVAPSPAHFNPGDVLWVSVPVNRGGYVSVALLDAAGEATVLARSPLTDPLPPGAIFEVDGALVLDQDVHKEWLVALIHDHPLSDEAVAREVSALLPDPTASATGCCSWALDITRGR